jgi:hypothetical protein
MVESKAGRAFVAAFAVAMIVLFVLVLLVSLKLTSFLFVLLSIVVSVIVFIIVFKLLLPQHVKSIERIIKLIPKSASDEKSKLLKELAVLAENHKKIEIPLQNINYVEFPPALRPNKIIISTEHDKLTLKFDIYGMKIFDIDLEKWLTDKKACKRLVDLFRQLNVKVNIDPDFYLYLDLDRLKQLVE